MIIGINEKQEVIYTATGIAEKYTEVDNVTTFRVDSKPYVEEGATLCFNPDTAEFYSKAMPTIDAEEIKARNEKRAKRNEAERKRANALQWLADNDWKVNKRTLGEWAENDERWLAYLADRAKVRAEYDEATAELNG